MNWDWEKLKEQQRKTGGGGGQKPPQVDELLDKMKNVKFTGGPKTLILVLLVAALVWSSFYTIETGSVGVIQRFGKFVRIGEPGLNFKLPLGIEKVTKVSKQRVYQEEFGLRGGTSSNRRFTSDSESVALMLTGDLNVALVPWIVLYRVKDAEKYLFKVHNVTGLLRTMSETSMRLVVGDRSINEVISKRKEIADAAKVVLQEELDKAQAGIIIQEIEMKETNVPKKVQPFFNEVNQAGQEKERMIYQAREEYNKVIPAAKGEAERTIKAAEGYATDRVNRAKGDAARFMALYTEYAKAKDVTKRRIYLEKLKELLPKLGPKYIIDGNQKNLLPLLNLGKQLGNVNP